MKDQVANIRTQKGLWEGVTQDNDYCKDLKSFIDLPDIEVGLCRRFVNLIRANPRRGCVDAIDAMTLIENKGWGVPSTARIC